MTPFVRPAPWYRRLAASVINIALLAAALVVIAKNLPTGPPPANAMAFFSPQDFTNYFTLVGAALVLTAAAVGLLFSRLVRATPGQLVLGLKLVSLDRVDAPPLQIVKRWLTSMASVALIMFPGPLIALLIGSIAASVLGAPFSTVDRLLLSMGLPDVLRYFLHGLSFLALFAGVWVVAVHPAIKYFENKNEGLTLLDRWTSTTVAVRSSL